MWARGLPFVLGVQTDDERPRDAGWSERLSIEYQMFTKMHGLTGKVWRRFVEVFFCRGACIELAHVIQVIVTNLHSPSLFGLKHRWSSIPQCTTWIGFCTTGLSRCRSQAPMSFVSQKK